MTQTILDKNTCKCKCKPLLKGEEDKGYGSTCGDCNLKDEMCQNGGKANRDSCQCDRCEGPYNGTYCDKCKLSPHACTHGGVYNHGSCKCVGCPKPWVGVT